MLGFVVAYVSFSRLIDDAAARRTRTVAPPRLRPARRVPARPGLLRAGSRRPPERPGLRPAGPGAAARRVRDPAERGLAGAPGRRAGGQTGQAHPAGQAAEARRIAARHPGHRGRGRRPHRGGGHRPAAHHGLDVVRRPAEDRAACRSDTIPLRVQQAVLAIEDQSFYSHPGINPFRLALVAMRNLVGGEAPAGASTITQQLARMFFLSDEFNAELQSGERGPQPGLLRAQGAREPDVAGARDAARRSTRSSSCT